jgi:MAF protein
VIGADTVVILNNRILGKPRDQIEAKQMLQDLRGTHHHVTTGLTVVNIASGRSLTETVTSEINLRNFSDHEIDTFIVSGVPLDKAGAYAIQDLAFHPAESMTGCYSNIVGLPLCRLLEMLKELGCPLPPQSSLSIPSSCENCQGNKRSKP